MAGLYIHIPFCKQACHYCNFHFSTTQKNKQQIVGAIASEMNLRKGYLNGENISSIYFGGGTPSILSVDEIKHLLNSVYDNFIVEDNAEITLEANPDDLTIEKIYELAQTKINRLSIGIQSFFDEDLIWMNRAHHSKQALDCISNAKKAGFKNITIDLIYGMPTLTDEKWIANLETALSLNIDHISSYALTVENKTALDYLIRQKKTLPVNEEQSARQFEMLISILGKNKFEQYEISNFARNKKYAIHNTSYWKNEIYLGVGPSAHSFNKITRCWNVANNVSYLKAIEQNNPLFETEILTIENRLNEYIMTGLRTIWGCDIQFIESEFGQSYSEKITQEIVKMQSAGLIEIKGDIFTLTPKAKLFADKIASDLFQ
ncbi:MAG: radical SAM family heme chaperone HemW [Bacteroidota bacterium]